VTANRQLATDNRQQKACNGQRATDNGRRATGNVQHATGNVQHTTDNGQHTTDNIQRTTGNGRQRANAEPRATLPRAGMGPPGHCEYLRRTPSAHAGAQARLAAAVGPRLRCRRRRPARAGDECGFSPRPPGALLPTAIGGPSALMGTAVAPLVTALGRSEYSRVLGRTRPAARNTDHAFRATFMIALYHADRCWTASCAPRGRRCG
jgi:hypothetical protein